MKLTKRISVTAWALFVVWALCATPPAQAQSLIVLYNFTGPPDGNGPFGALLLDQAGNLYGTTAFGGASNWGVVFKVDPSGNESVLHTFTGTPDGGQPYGGLVQDAAGNLYGATRNGGTAAPCPIDNGCGTIFRVDPSGKETVLHVFGGGDGSDGKDPLGRLVLDNSGTLWGITETGGQVSSECVILLNGQLVDLGCGTVFELNPNGFLSIVHRFGDPANGVFPVASLLQDAAGNFYGTTSDGGLRNCPINGLSGCGTVFKVGADNFSVLYSFQGAPDGAIPFGGLVEDAVGNLYGTTYYGGTSNAGTIFKLDPTGNETVLYSFTPFGQYLNGAFPTGGVVRDAAGNFYGIARGAVFKLDSSGNESILYAFPYPDELTQGDLVADANGNMYGITQNGGTTNSGTVFKLTTFPEFGWPAFTLTPKTVNRGGSASTTMDLITVNGFTDTVTFACSVSPRPQQAPQCSVSPASATPGTPVTVTVTTSGPSAGLTSRFGAAFSYAIWLPLLGLVGLGRRGSIQRENKAMLLGCVLFASVVFEVACGGGGSGSGSGGNTGTPAGTYAITVTGTSSATTASLVRSTVATLTVQ